MGLEVPYRGVNVLSCGLEVPYMGINVLSCGVRSTIHGGQRVELWG